MKSSEIMAFYRNHHRTYEDNQTGSNERLAQFVIERSLDQSVCVLNIGSATRLPLERQLLNRTNGRNPVARERTAGLHLMSIDITMQAAARVVRRHHRDLAARTTPTFTVEAAAADMRFLPFANGSLDFVVSNLALDILPGDDRLAAFKEARRVLRPNGALYAHLHSADIAADIQQHGFNADHYWGTTEDVQEFMEPLGFSDVSVGIIAEHRPDVVDYFTLLAEK